MMGMDLCFQTPTSHVSWETASRCVWDFPPLLPLIASPNDLEVNLGTPTFCDLRNMYALPLKQSMRYRNIIQSDPRRLKLIEK